MCQPNVFVRTLMSNRGSDIHWRQLRRSLLHAALRFTEGLGDAEDLVQASFERFMGHADLDAVETHAPLLHTIMRRLAIDRARRLRRWRFEELSVLGSSCAEEPSP